MRGHKVKRPSYGDDHNVPIMHTNGRGPERYEIFPKTYSGEIKLRRFINGRINWQGYFPKDPKLIKELFHELVRIANEGSQAHKGITEPRAFRVARDH